MSKIYELSIGYRIAKKLVISAFSLYYDEIIVTGAENIPKNGRFIFAPNHRNALMDALAILYITPKNVSTSFLGRSDIFKKKKIASFLRFSKIMPAFRIRDGYENLSRNNEVFDECVDLLEHDHALCIMPEGNQDLPQKIRPFVKGIFRIAFALQLKNKTDRALQIVPVGLDYGDIVKFGKHLIINVGKPIDVSDYIELYSDNQALAMNEIKKELTNRLKTLAMHIDSDENHDTILQAIDFSCLKMLKNNNQRFSKLNKFIARKQLADTLCLLEKESPEQLTEIAVKCNELTKRLEKDGIQSRNLYNRKNGKTLLLRSLGLFISSPIFVVGFTLNILSFQMPVLIRKLLKVEYEGFIGSIQFVLGLITFPLFYILQSVAICILFNINALIIPFLIALHLFSGIIAYKWYAYLKKTIAESKYYFQSDKEKKHLKELRKEIMKKVGIYV